MNSNESNFNINDFSKSQLEEIQKGLEQKLNVSVYAKKEFLAIQMRQIRLGLQDKLPVEKYANPSFDWFQMEQIRMGLKDGMISQNMQNLKYRMTECNKSAFLFWITLIYLLSLN